MGCWFKLLSRLFRRSKDLVHLLSTLKNDLGIWWIACGSFVDFIMTSYVQDFIENPSFEAFERCRKEELIVIADHFRISVRQQLLKREIKDFLLHRLVELDILVLSEAEGEADQIAVDAQSIKAGEEVVRLAGMETEVESQAALPLIELLSPATPGSIGESKLKVRLVWRRRRERRHARANLICGSKSVGWK